MTNSMTYTTCNCPGICSCASCACDTTASREAARSTVISAVHMAIENMSAKVQQLFSVLPSRDMDIVASRNLDALGYSRKDALELLKEEF